MFLKLKKRKRKLSKFFFIMKGRVPKWEKYEAIAISKLKVMYYIKDLANGMNRTR